LAAKLFAVALVLGLVAGALWLGGALQPPSPGDVGPSLAGVEPARDEGDWAAKVGAICGWERRQNDALERAFRRAVTPRDVELYLESAMSLATRTAGVFDRLQPPFAYRREVRELRRLLWRQQRGLENMLAAFKRRDRRAFVGAVRQLVRFDERTAAIFADLGVDGCGVKPVDLPESSRTRVI
jgi:hypothetical protein